MSDMRQRPASPSYDVIVVGAGSSGSVLAARLTERSDRRVLLVEAGPHYSSPSDYPGELMYGDQLGGAFPGHPNNWSFVGHLTEGKPFSMPRGRVVGGSSAINGAAFVRGRRADFDEWAALGNSEWAYDKVVPYYARAETDLDFSASSSHGASGPIPIRRPKLDELHPLSEAFTAACLGLGFPYEADKNGEQAEGVGPIPSNCIDGVRMNTAMTHLDAALARPNLTLLSGATVRRVKVDHLRAVGIEVDIDGARSIIYGNEIVLAAGAIMTPHLLALSGIGPADSLRSAGIAVVQDSPGVGQNIVDHPSVSIRYRVNTRSYQDIGGVMPFQVALNYVDPSIDDGDTQILCSTVSRNEMIRRRTTQGAKPGFLPSYLTRPIKTLNGLRRLPMRYVLAEARSGRDPFLICTIEREESRGTIRTIDNDPTRQPEITLNYLTGKRDMERMRQAVRTGVKLLRSSEFRALGAQLVSPLGRNLGSDEALNHWISSNISSSYHTSGSARMGPDTDRFAVVDQYCRVRGVDGLRIADISVLPSMVRRAPNATAVMIGERVSEFFD